MINAIQPGKVIDFVAAAAVSSGQAVVIGQVLGVSTTTLAIGEAGTAHLDGVFELPKVTTAVIGQGDSVNWDVSAGKIDAKTATPASGDISGAAAFAFEAAGNGATTVRVKLTGVPGTLTA